MGSQIQAGTIQQIRDGVITEGPVYLQVRTNSLWQQQFYDLTGRAKSQVILSYGAGVGTAAAWQKAQGSVLRWHRQHRGSVCLDSQSTHRVGKNQQWLCCQADIVHLQLGE